MFALLVLSCSLAAETPAEAARQYATTHQAKLTQEFSEFLSIPNVAADPVNLVKVLPKLEAAGVNVKVIAAISEELFDRQPQAYRDSVLPPEARYDLMVVSTGTRRMWPLRNLGPLTDEYSLTSDFDNSWRSGGLELEVIAEAHLDPDSIFAGVERFANERERRIGDQRKMIG